MVVVISISIYIIGVLLMYWILLSCIKSVEKKPSGKLKIILAIISMLSWVLILSTMLVGIVLILIDKIVKGKKFVLWK